MPGGIRTLTVTPSFDIEREAVTYEDENDYDNTGLFAVYSRAGRPAYKFRLNVSPLVQIQQQSLSAFHFFHQGSKPFFFDGGKWSSVSALNLIGEGDGTRTEFLLPNRFINADSISVAVYDGTTTSLTSAFSLNADPGIIVFDTAPDSGDDIMASHGHKYKCLFAPRGLKVAQIAAGVWRAEVNLRETII